VRGKPLPHAYRIVFLDEAAKWMRQALAVLRHPERRSQLSIGSAIAPIGYWRRRDTRSGVQVAFDLDALATIPGRTGRTGTWEAGALLASDDGKQQWDLLSVFESPAQGASARWCAQGRDPGASPGGSRPDDQ
jgi:hypothetical protein